MLVKYDTKEINKSTMRMTRTYLKYNIIFLYIKTISRSDEDISCTEKKNFDNSKHKKNIILQNYVR